MNIARADALTARERLAATGWIPANSEFFRHLPPPALAAWLGEEADAAPARVDTDRRRGAGWTLHPSGHGQPARVNAQWLDASQAGDHRALFEGLPPLGDRDADRFDWAHRVLCRHGLRLRIAADSTAREPVSLVLRHRPRSAVEAPMLVIDVQPGAHALLLEVHERESTAGPLVQNLDVHLNLGAGATLQHLRVATPGADDRVAHRVHARLGEGARYAQALIASGSRYHLQRSELELRATRASARLGGALFAADAALEQQVQTHHGAAHTESNVEALMLASGKARGVVNAFTRIEPGADEANVRQRLSGIPTGGQPKLILRPHLEILHDKVQAAHGATWGALPEDALFFARQRGLDEHRARALIVEGLITALLEGSVDSPEVLRSLGMSELLADVVARHLGTPKEIRHG